MAVKKATTKKEKPAKKVAVKKVIKKAVVKKTEKIHPVKSSEGGISRGEIISRGKEKAEEVKIVEKTVSHKAEIKKPEKTSEKYFYAVGRRKSAVAQVRLFEDGKATENDFIVNGRKFKEYFPTVSLQNNFLSPFKAVGMQNNFRMTVIVRGGGVTGQVEAVKLGIARALVVYDEKLKKTLKDLKLLTRDSRKVERKKAGFKKARKSPQWSKR